MIGFEIIKPYYESEVKCKTFHVKSGFVRV